MEDVTFSAAATMTSVADEKEPRSISECVRRFLASNVGDDTTAVVVAAVISISVVFWLGLEFKFRFEFEFGFGFGLAFLLKEFARRLIMSNIMNC